MISLIGGKIMKNQQNQIQGKELKTIKTFVEMCFDYDRVELINFYTGNIIFEGDIFKLKKLLSKNTIPNFYIHNVRSCVITDKTDEIESYIGGMVLNVSFIRGE